LSNAFLKVFFISAEIVVRVVIAAFSARETLDGGIGRNALTVLCAGEDCIMGIVIRSTFFQDRYRFFDSCSPS
jgi:hypothetical protein